MGLKIKGVEFVYPGNTCLRFNRDGTITDQREYRDHFDCVEPTFDAVPVVGVFGRSPYRHSVT